MSEREYLCYAQRTLPDGRLCEVVPLTFGRARLTINNKDFPLMLIDDSF